MPRKKQRANSGPESIGARYQAKLVKALPCAEGFAARILQGLATGEGVQERIDAALHELGDLLADIPDGCDDDERHGAELVATQNASYMLGVAVGRRLAAGTLSGSDGAR